MEGNNTNLQKDLQSSYSPSPNVQIGEQSGILFIGNFHQKNITTSNFNWSDPANNYLQAKRKLKAAFNTRKNLPALIVVNLPPDNSALESFVGFLKKRRWAADIPIVYHEGALTAGQLTELSALHLVDDITDVELFASELTQKAAFLKRTKMFLNDLVLSEEGLSGHNQKIKTDNTLHFIARRFLDIIIASTMFLLVSPIMILIMVLIRIESRGPAIYKSKRTGRGCRIFDFYKFRTMVEGAENSLAEMTKKNIYKTDNNEPLFFKALNDERITKIGRILRNTSLDELPQLINVIKGDMSLVGNRPLPLYEASTLTTDVLAERFMAPAGITGLWQVLKRGRKDVSIEERISLDINYARDNNIGRDLWILANTPKALFQKSNV